MESVVRYVEIRNVFRSTSDKYLLFVADAALRSTRRPRAWVRVNQTRVEVCAAFFNDAVVSCLVLRTPTRRTPCYSRRDTSRTM